MASLQTALDLKQRRDNRVPSAPPLCLNMQSSAYSYQLHPWPPARWRTQKVSWGWGQMLVHHQAQMQQQIAMKYGMI